MIRRSVIIFILVALSSCQLGPSKYALKSELTNQRSGGQACETTGPGFYTESGGDEVIAIKFSGGLDFFDLRPEGQNYSESPARWSKLSYNGVDTYAVLSTPSKLKVGDIDTIIGKQVCVTFYQGLFEDDELSLQAYSALAGQQCCGVLSKKKIVRE